MSSTAPIGHWYSLRFWAYTLLGVACGIISFKGFLIPNHFIDGGVNGISILLAHIFDVNVALPIILINLPFIWLGYRKIGKDFALQSLIAIILLAIGLHFIEIPSLTDDKVLIAIFGGMFIGLGIGFVIKGGGVIDGIEVIAAYTNQRSKFTTNEIMLVINICLFLALSYTFGLGTAMYSIITYYTGLKTADYVVDGFEQYTSMTIVSSEYEKIKPVLVNEFGKAISVYKGERGYLPGNFDKKQDCDIIVTVVTRLETFAIERAIYAVDSKAFITTQHIKEVRGGVIKQLRTH